MTLAFTMAAFKSIALSAPFSETILIGPTWRAACRRQSEGRSPMNLNGLAGLLE
jgi:hypothetical protein